MEIKIVEDLIASERKYNRLPRFFIPPICLAKAKCQRAERFRQMKIYLARYAYIEKSISEESETKILEREKKRKKREGTKPKITF